MKIPEKVQKIQNTFFAFNLSAFEYGRTNSHNLKQDICHRQSMS